MLESGVIKAYSASVQARIFVTVVVVPVVSFSIHPLGLAQATFPLTLLSTCPSVHPLGTAFILMFQLPNRLVEFTVFMLVPLTNVGCTATFPLHSKLVEFTVFMLVHDTNVACTVTAPVLPFTLVTGAVYVTAQVLQLKLVTHVELVKNQLGLVESYGVYHKAVVTSPLFIPVINQESLFNSDTFVGIVGIAHQSFIIFPVFPSNNAKCQSVLELGHTTSHAHSQSAQS